MSSGMSRSMKRTNTARSPTHERRDAEHRVALHRLGVFAASVFSGRPTATSAATASASRPTEVAISRSTSSFGDLRALVVAGRERGDVPVEELVGERVAHRDAPHERESRRCPITAGSRSQTGGSPSSTCTWSSENGTNVTSQSRPSRNPATTDSCALRANGQR